MTGKEIEEAIKEYSGKGWENEKENNNNISAEHEMNEIKERCKSDTRSDAKSDKRIELTEEQQEHYELMIEHVALEMKVFEDSRRNSKDTDESDSESAGTITKRETHNEKCDQKGKKDSIDAHFDE